MPIKPGPDRGELPQTDTYHARRKRTRPHRRWLPTLAIAGAIAVLVLAVAVPLWLPWLARRVIPDRYIIAYAPEPLREILLNIDPSRTLPTPVPDALVDVAGGETVALTPGATPWPTIAAAPPTGQVSPTGTAIPPTDEVAEGNPPATEVAESEPPIVEEAGSSAFAVAVPASIPTEHLLLGAEQIPQGYNKCGPATLTSYLTYWGFDVTQNDVSDATKPHPEDSNVRPEELAEYVHSLGFGAVTRVNGTLNLLKRLIAAGYPVMIERGFDELPDQGWMGHFMLMIGYSDEVGEFTALDSYWGTNRLHDDPSFPVDAWSYARFDNLWQDFNRTYIVAYPPDEAEEVAAMIGPDMDDGTMYVNALQRLLAERDQNPTDPFAWYNLGEVYNALGDYPSAAQAFDMARQNSMPWRMSWYLFGHYEAYFQVGRYEDVLTLAQYTTDPTNYPESEEAFYYMGLVYAARDQDRLARSMFQKALQYNPNYEAAQQALAQLEG